ncbi:MAG: efflux RND transporter permease subunit, partial [Myxococcota bacterium]
MLKAYARWITHHAVLVLVITGLVTVAAIAQLVDFRTGTLRLQLDTSIEQMLPTGDENRAFYNRMRRLFGNDETLLLVVHRPEGIFTTEVLGGIARLSKRVQGVEGVASVLSLSTAPNISAHDGDLNIAPLFETPPSDPAELERVKQAAFDNPLYVGAMVAPGGKTTSLVIQLVDIPESEFTRLEPSDFLPRWLTLRLGLAERQLAERAIDKQIRALAQEEFGEDVQIWLVGSAHIKAELTRHLIRDLRTTIPLAFLLIIAVAAVSFRTVRGVVIPVSTIVLSSIWTLAVMVAIDPKLNLVTISVPMLLIVIGFAYGVHVMATYNDAIEEGRSWDASAATRGLYTVLLPTFLTGGSTATGFLTLVTHSLAAIRQFGLYGGIGVLLAATAAITFAPAVLQLLREPEPEGRHHEAGHTAFDRVVARIGAFDARNATRIFAAVALLCVLAVAGIPRIQVNSTMVSNFPEQSAVRKSVEAVNQHLGGAGQLNIVLETDYPKGFTEPSILKIVEDLQAWLAKQPTVTGSLSILDYIKLIHRGFNDNAPDQFTIPASRNLTTQLLFFGASDETKRFVDSQYQIANVLVRTTALDSGDLGAVVKSIEQRLAALPESVRGRVTGNLALITKTNDEIAYGQAVSVTSAFLSIFAIMAALFMSLRIGIIAMIPN